MREHDGEITELGGRVAVISFASPEHLAAFAKRLQHPYLWLADPDRASYRALGLGRHGLRAVVPLRVLWGYLQFALQGKIWRPEQTDLAQMGGDFVFDRDGELTLSYASHASDDRPPVTEVIAALRRAARERAAEL